MRTSRTGTLTLTRISHSDSAAETERHVSTLRSIGLPDALHEYACVGRPWQDLYSRRRFRLFVTSRLGKCGLATAILLTVPLFGVLAQERDWSIFLPQHPSRHLVTRLCLTCHDLQPILNRGGDYRFWEDSVRSMNSEGADIRPDEMAKLSEYLSTYFGPDRKPLAIPIELNSVTREEIELVHPIADQAEAILRERARRNGFKDVQELLEVDGITPERFEKVRSFLYIEDAG